MPLPRSPLFVAPNWNKLGSISVSMPVPSSATTTSTAFGRPVTFRNTNGLVRSSHWEIGLSKTGYISEAGRCLVMRVRLASKDLIVVLLDSWGKHSRLGDANRIKKWLESHTASQRSS